MMLVMEWMMMGGGCGYGGWNSVVGIGSIHSLNTIMHIIIIIVTLRSSSVR